MLPAARLMIDPIFSIHVHVFPTPGLGIPPDTPPFPPVCLPHVVMGITTGLARMAMNLLFHRIPYTVYINGMPAAQCSDGGYGFKCCGPSTHDVFTGSSTVNIEGDRAARLLDSTFHCDLLPIKPMNPPQGPPKPGGALPPFGIITSGSPNVFIGGAPLPSFMSIVGGFIIQKFLKMFKLILKGLGKIVKITSKKVAETLEKITAKSMDKMATSCPL